MAKFGKTSKKRLSTCHEDLQTVFNEVIKHVDALYKLINKMR